MNMNYIKSNLQFLITIALAVFIVILTCNRPAPDPVVKIVRDTQWVKTEPILVPDYQPFPYETKVPVIIPNTHTPAPNADIAEVKRLLAELNQKYYSTNKYNDKLNLKDSSGNTIAELNLKDDISENTVKNRKYDYTLNVPTIRETITIKDPPGRGLYYGAGITGSFAPSINGGNIGLMYRDKKDNHYQVQVGGIQVPGSNGLHGYAGLSYYKKF
jgi:hypothetical protein